MGVENGVWTVQGTAILRHQDIGQQFLLLLQQEVSRHRRQEVDHLLRVQKMVSDQRGSRLVALSLLIYNKNLDYK